MTNPQTATTSEAKRPEDMSLDELREAVDQESANPSPAPAAPKTEQPKEDDDGLPEKFRGKSAKDIAEAYSNLEKKLGEMSSERAHGEREKEALNARLYQIEQELTKSRQPVAEKDPLEDIEKEVDVDPVGTVKKLAAYVRTANQSTRKSVLHEVQRTQANDYYNRQMKENPDFAALEPEMQGLARQLGPLVRPEYLESPAMIDALYLIARGRNISRYTKEAEEKAKKAVDLVKQEKRQAFSESSGGSQGSSAKDFSKKSLEEMRAELGVVGED